MNLDRHQRPLRDLRISVTDRCNLRCSYCMPYDHYEWMPRTEILSFEEITRLARIFVGFGVRKIRLTGGEPLLRHNLDTLVSKLVDLDGLETVCLTTNGTRLAEQAAALRQAGLHRLNVSLDSTDPVRFRETTKWGDLKQVLHGLEVAQQVGFDPIKINMVVQRGRNQDQILPMLEFCKQHGHSLRYIEFMDVGNANEWQLDQVVPKKEILAVLEGHIDRDSSRREFQSDPAELYPLAGGRGDVGIIASVSSPFCGGCSRARLTAEGKLVTCLFSATGTDLKTPLRAGATDGQLRDEVARIWQIRDDRYSEQRLADLRSAAGYDPRQRAKLEMISLGG